MSIASALLPQSDRLPYTFVPVQVEVLRWFGAVGVDLFTPADGGAAPLLYYRAGGPMVADRLVELQRTGVENLFVRSCDFAVLSSDLLDALENVLQTESIPAADRFAALQLAVAVEIEQTLRAGECDKFVALADQVGAHIASLVCSGDLLPRDMFNIARHDFYTFTHVTNVAGYSVLLADRLGIHDADELRQIASGAMLHDIGKRAISKNVLAKPSGLTEEERELIESHPLRGYEELCLRSDLSLGQLMMVYQHHEHVDGNGYPVGILGDEIHPWAKLLAVVDVFDALTGKRAYRRPTSAESACAPP